MIYAIVTCLLNKQETLKLKISENPDNLTSSKWRE